MPDYRMLKDLAEGNSIVGSAKIKTATDINRSHFFQAIVLEVISDPKKITEQKIDYWQKVLKINTSWSFNFLNSPKESEEKNFPRVPPRNSIIAQKKLDGHTRLSVPMLMVPFFPSHIALPCKPGELVWGMYEDPYAGGNKIAYWMCSVVQPYFIEDVNHTHAPLALRQPTAPKVAGDIKIPYQMQNGATVLVKGSKNDYKDEKGNVIIGTDPLTKFIPSDDQFVFEKLVTQTDASKICAYEQVPRFHKRPGDVVLEGSNNSLIVLGTDRTSKLGEYNAGALVKISTTDSVSTGLSPKWPVTDFQTEAGMIDMVVGRGYSENTGGNPIEITEIKNPASIIRKEQDKLNPAIDEGDPDLVNDRSRIQISQKTLVDKNFKLSDYFTSIPEAPSGITDSSTGDAAIVIKSDKIRLIARSDISFIVTNWNENVDNRTGNIFKQEETSFAKWASITIKSNGDIVFTPSEQGLIKLGGEDADKAILCTDNLAPGAAGKPVVNEGKVSFVPGIISTGADLIGTGKPKQGTFATKILVK
jgi:hypothetical protein